VHSFILVIERASIVFSHALNESHVLCAVNGTCEDTYGRINNFREKGAGRGRPGECVFDLDGFSLKPFRKCHSRRH